MCLFKKYNVDIKHKCWPRFSDYVQGVARNKRPRVFFIFSGNSRAQKSNKSQKKQANIMGIQYFFAYQQVESTSSFIIYPLLILIPHHLYLLPFSPCYDRWDNAVITVIVIMCSFRQVGPYLCRHCRRYWFRIQYTREGTLTLSAITHWDMDPLLWSNCCHSTGGGKHGKFLINPPLYYSLSFMSPYIISAPCYVPHPIPLSTTPW